jgi:hypothetical protein
MIMSIANRLEFDYNTDNLDKTASGEAEASLFPSQNQIKSTPHRLSPNQWLGFCPKNNA